MPIVFFIILILYSVIWASINLYNLYPVLSYQLDKGINQKTEKRELPQKLPTISILIPAYHEEAVLENSIKHIFQADYPKELLDVIVLTEPDDTQTIAIAKRTIVKYGTRHVMVEQNKLPKGKPRALNFGLNHVRGEIIGVTDAEDVIDKRLFKEVVSMLNSGFDAVQGVLDMINDRDGFKNMHLRAEYRYWYRGYLPALVHSNFPVPLGGTTNFFKRSVLHELNGWDPYNLTEDFDLGIRLYNEHKKVGVAFDMLRVRNPQSIFHNKYELGLIKSVTKEESPVTWEGWLHQRTRWQRGKIQTLKKILARPPKNLNQKMHSIFVSILPHLGFINITGILFSIYIYFTNTILPSWIYLIFGFNFVMLFYYCAINGKGYYDAVHKNRQHRFAGALFVAVTTPIYWVMQWLADIRAMKQEYIDKTIFWEKTQHFGKHMHASYSKPRK